MVGKALAKKLAQQERKLRVIYVGSYIPRECGIATFTKDLTTSINILNPHCLAEIMAVDEPGIENRGYPWEVKYRIHQDDINSYISAADYINQSSAEVISIQHEFGIYGGKNGEYIIPFMERIKKPIITTFHTVLPKPDEHRLQLVKKIAKKSAVIIVMIDIAAERLVDVYQIPPEKIVVIPHGVPDIPYSNTTYPKKELGFGCRTVISTFGLINPGKGIEDAIQALPAVIKKYPDIIYLVLGATHPTLVRNYGEEYRHSLEKLVGELQLGNHVHFENRYLELDELIQYLRATDVYVTPYRDPQQITSGTLAYAVGTGRACVSTPYLYAQEVLADGRGVKVKFSDPTSISKAIVELLKNPERRRNMEKEAYLYGRSMIWANVALKHLDLFWLIAQEERKGN